MEKRSGKLLSEVEEKAKREPPLQFNFVSTCYTIDGINATLGKLRQVIRTKLHRGRREMWELPVSLINSIGEQSDIEQREYAYAHT